MLKTGSLILKVKGDQRALSALESAELHVPSLIVEVGGTLEIVGAASLFVDVLNVSPVTLPAGCLSVRATVVVPS